MTFLERYETLLGKLPGDSALRAAASDAFRSAGLPGATRGRPSEAWKYTSLRSLAETRFRSGEPKHEAETILARLPLLDVPRLVFVDGKFSDRLSVHTANDGDGTAKSAEAPLSSPGSLKIARFADQPDFGTLTWPDREPMVALNTMLAEDGVSLHIPANHDCGTIQLISVATTDADLHPRHTIRLDAGAKLTLIEMSAGEGVYFLNTVAEIHVADGAHLTHIRLQDESLTAFHISTTYAEVAATATYDSFTLNIGARLCRTEVHATLAGEHATAHLNAVQLLMGAQHADFTSVVGHLAPHGTSRQTVKNVLSGRSRGVFQGRIEVARAAQKTDGYQMNQALLLSPDAEIDSKPELEIFADDVKCSHGATVGELDAEQIFYLRSRGVPDAEARSILVRAFLSEALDAVTDEAVRGSLERAVESWWQRNKA